MQHATNNEHKLRMWSTTGKKCVFIHRKRDEIWDVQHNENVKNQKCSKRDTKRDNTNERVRERERMTHVGGFSRIHCAVIRAMMYKS